MDVYNVTRGRALAKDVESAFTFWRRLKGLLGRRTLSQGSGLLIKPCNSIHSFFMRFPFDALFLDDSMVVVYIIERMPPFRISPLIRNAKAVLELPAGTVSFTGTSIGDRLAISDSRS